MKIKKITNLKCYRITRTWPFRGTLEYETGFWFWKRTHIRDFVIPKSTIRPFWVDTQEKFSLQDTFTTNDKCEVLIALGEYELIEIPK